jgi:uncharacterized protein YidB (DUF937 family)
MARGLPSMTALLGMLAIAGYQNRDKISEILKGTSAGNGSQQGLPSGLGRFLGGLGGNTSGGGLLGGGLSALLEAFRQNGHADTADSWVSMGPNKPVESTQIRQAIGPEVLGDLAQRTGLSEEEILSRLSKRLPDAVDRYTPEGKLPSS